ncbi:hypothetical protein DFH09DRAFT_1366966 [Mycena vulgaris]|nr:hypothetical protein DFH09DRAFT_1366966 [Mycena vulgaris]
MEVDNEPVVRVQELWFDDGNLIIQAGSSLFRVYRGVLAARSSVFQDMLSFPQPPESDLVEGCPLVRLHDSSAEVTVFLKAIFDSGFFEMYPSPTKIDVLTGVLRLSHKYAVDYLRRRALGHLSSALFTRLSAHDNAEAPGNSSRWKRPSWTIPDDLFGLIKIIQLAREVDAPWVLPYAFYRLADRSATDEVDLPTCLQLQFFEGALAQLCEDDGLSFTKGYCVQISTGTTDVLHFLQFPPTISGCLTKYDCLLARLDALEQAHEDRRSSAYQADPLLLWSGPDWGRLQAIVCGICLKSLNAAHQKALQDFWNQLPGMYGLPEWADLEKMKAEALGP